MSRSRLEGLHTIKWGTRFEINHVDMAFLASSIPGISIRDRIGAVCGATDDRGSASPRYNGWFFSDHLLHPTWRCDPHYNLLSSDINI